MGEAGRMLLETTEMDGFTDEQFLTLFPQAWKPLLLTFDAHFFLALKAMC